ncbi:MAG: hypothetical protein LBT71_05065 [Azoarcus sp.]|jgi:hypothetical protein|nr:hypothetical protein [Azoarcus sp.]
MSQNVPGLPGSSGEGAAEIEKRGSVMTIQRFIVVSSVSVMVSACNMIPQRPVDNVAGMNVLVVDAATDGKIVEKSVFRSDDKVALALRIPGKWIPVGEIYVQVSCSMANADWLYADHRRYGRRYSSGGSIYSRPLTLNENSADALRKLPQVQEACERTPDWRQVAYDDKGDEQIILDVSSIAKQADGSFLFWSAFDHAWLGYDVPYKAPYGRKVEYFSVNCQENAYAQLSGYDLDQQQTVTDGRIELKAKTKNISADFNDYYVLMQAVCGPKEKLALLPRPQTRVKRFPDFSVLPASDAKVLSQLSSLKLTSPKIALNYLRLEGTRTFAKGEDVLLFLRGKSLPSLEEIWVERTGTPNIYRTERRAGKDVTKNIEFLGMLRVSQTGSTHNFFTQALELHGNWNIIPMNSQLVYKQITRHVDIVTSQSSYEAETTCDVSRELLASELNSRLLGNAKELICQNSGKNSFIETQYYLEDYGFVVMLKRSSSWITDDVRIVDFR